MGSIRDLMRERAGLTANADAAAEQHQEQARGRQQALSQNYDQLVTGATSFAIENPMVGVPTLLFVAWMRRTTLKNGQKAIDAFTELRTERGRESVVPGEKLEGAHAVDAKDFLVDNSLEAEWAAAPEVAQVLGPPSDLVAKDPLASGHPLREPGQTPRGPQLG